MRRHSEVTPGSLVYRGGAGPFGDPQASPFSSTQPIAEDAPYTASYGYGSEVTPDVVKVKPGKNATEVEVSCPDRRGLGFALARIMFAFGLNVVKGDFSIDGSWCFVVFHVRMGDERHDHTSPFWTTLKKRIEEECPDAAPQLIPHADGIGSWNPLDIIMEAGDHCCEPGAHRIHVARELPLRRPVGRSRWRQLLSVRSLVVS